MRQAHNLDCYQLEGERSAHTEEIVPATSPGDQFPSCELPIFTRKSSRKDLFPQIMLVSACDQLFVGQVAATKLK